MLIVFGRSDEGILFCIAFCTKFGLKNSMLSKIASTPVLWRSLGLKKSLLSPVVKSTTSSTAVVNYAEEKEKLMAKLKQDFPQPYNGPERDLVNFPKRKRFQSPGKVRFAIFPDEWFTYFYKKTGVTGPYVFGFGLITFLLSKELYVIEDELSTGVAQVLLIYIAVKKLGPKVKEWYFKANADAEQNLENARLDNMKNREDEVEMEKKFQWHWGIVDTLATAKKENVQMQLETEYRRRLMTVYEQVKKRLDYHLEIDSTRRKLEQKHMVEWIVDSVMKSITPQQEKDALQKCLVDLKALSAKA